ncbi:hypothetical protein HY411_02075 [Candidatus Gottesmanbacteria bacterium]|nr:hypothetical protein [Candidatus Gottesmanbacteria bacterium]
MWSFVLGSISVLLLLSIGPNIGRVHALAGTLSVESSSSTSSGNILLGNSKSLRTAYGPLMLDFKSDPDSWSPGLVIREVSGNVGIGTLSPSSQLDVNGVIEAASIIDTANPAYYLDAANVNDSLVVAGNVAIGKTSPTAKLDVAGGVVLGDNTSAVAIDGTNIDISSAGAVTLTGNLVLSADPNEGISGGGLTNCITSTSKLLWSASTNKFSCGIDDAGGTVLVEKEADETVNNSNTLQDDDHIKYTMIANTAYAVEVSISYTSPTASPDFKYAFTIPTSATMSLMGQGFTTTTNVANCRIITSGSACSLTGNAAPDWIITIVGIVQTAGTAGDLQFQWAQNTAQEENTVVKKNSWMKVSPLSGASDLAEIYETDDPTIEAGHIVAIAKRGRTWIGKSSRPYDTRMIGIVSTKPSTVMGSAPEGGTPVAVALTGRVPVQIDPASEPIEPGDFLTSSKTPGLAIKAVSPGYIVAKALEHWNPQAGQHMIEAFVTLGFVDPDLSIITKLQHEIETLKTRLSQLEERLGLSNVH